MQKTNMGYVLFQHHQTSQTTSGSDEMIQFALFACSRSSKKSLSLALLHQCSCKHHCRQLWRALPFNLLSLSCVKGQIAAVSHTQYLTQSPELCSHPPSELLLPLPHLPSLNGRLSAVSKGQLHLLPNRGLCPTATAATAAATLFDFKHWVPPITKSPFFFG